MKDRYLKAILLNYELLGFNQTEELIMKLSIKFGRDDLGVLMKKETVETFTKQRFDYRYTKIIKNPTIFGVDVFYLEEDDEQ